MEYELIPLETFADSVLASSTGAHGGNVPLNPQDIWLILPVTELSSAALNG